jgi:hypothetical protein
LPHPLGGTSTLDDLDRDKTKAIDSPRKD